MKDDPQTLGASESARGNVSVFNPNSTEVATRNTRPPRARITGTAIRENIDSHSKQGEEPLHANSRNDSNDTLKLAQLGAKVASIPGVSIIQCKNLRTETGPRGRRRLKCDVHAVLADNEIITIEGAVANPKYISRHILRKTRDNMQVTKGRRKNCDRKRTIEDIATPKLALIDSQYTIIYAEKRKIPHISKSGKCYLSMDTARSVLQVSHPTLGNSAEFELRALVRNDPPSDPHSNTRDFIAACTTVHNTYEGVKAVGYYLDDQGRRRIQVELPPVNGRRPISDRLMQQVHINASSVQMNEGRKIPWTQRGGAHGHIVALLLVTLPGNIRAIKVGKTSRSHHFIKQSFAERRYNFEIDEILRYAVFENDSDARQFDSNLLAATSPWQIEVPKNIAGNTEFRHLEQITVLIAEFERLAAESGAESRNANH